MHPFPPASDLQFLVGQEITQICLGRWDLQLHFLEGGSIAVQGDILFIDSDGMTHAVDFEPPILPPFLHRVLLQPIIEIQAEPFKLAITFASGVRIQIPSDEGMYECGQIYPTRDRSEPIVF